MVLRKLTLIKRLIIGRFLVDWWSVFEVHVSEIAILSVGSRTRSYVQLIDPIRTLLKSINNIWFRGTHSRHELLRISDSSFSKRIIIFARARQPIDLFDKSNLVANFGRFGITKAFRFIRYLRIFWIEIGSLIVELLGVIVHARTWVVAFCCYCEEIIEHRFARNREVVLPFNLFFIITRARELRICRWSRIVRRYIIICLSAWAKTCWF